MTIRLNLGCSLEAMRTMEDNTYDLAVVDPPYEIKTKNPYQGGGKLKNIILHRDNKIQQWDIAPPAEYWNQLFRVSKNQIIWGGNYFDLPPTRCVIVWDKCQPWDTFSQVELAWTSFSKPAKLFRFDNRTPGKIHPTQKPVALYSWIFDKFKEPDMKILDTHLGSGSIAIAAHNHGLHLDAWEIDPDYHAAAVSRFEKHTRQLKLF